MSEICCVFEAQNGCNAEQKIIRTRNVGISFIASGHSALHFAAIKGNFNITELLLQAGADVNAKVSDGNFTALHLACHKGNLAIGQCNNTLYKNIWFYLIL